MDIVVVDNNAIQNDQARLGITWSGQYGELPDPIHYNSTDGDIRQFATEAVRNGDVPGIRADAAVNFTDFVVERFASTAERPWNTVQLRPKTPFGSR